MYICMYVCMFVNNGKRENIRCGCSCTEVGQGHGNHEAAEGVGPYVSPHALCEGVRENIVHDRQTANHNHREI